MTGYEIAKLIHILGVIGLFTGSGIAFAGMLRMRQAADVRQMREWTALASGPARGLPLTLLFILLPGIYMVEDVWGWDTPWMSVGLTMYLLMLPLALAINLRRLLALHRATSSAPDGLVPASLDRQRRDPILWTSVQVMTAVDIGIVVLMVTKPGLGGSLTTIGIALAVGIAVSLPLWRAQRPHGAVAALAGQQQD